MKAIDKVTLEQCKELLIPNKRNNSCIDIAPCVKDFGFETKYSKEMEELFGECPNDDTICGQCILCWDSEVVE